ncbi:hypothetical protein AB4Y72_11820 [Arthrobacter sp. YAF34]|uniref:hypothetical protein n=1 Tax=Arthrobacter sp. YAF34 TaxID=3233083 RepID=UPI003F8E60FB
MPPACPLAAGAVVGTALVEPAGDGCGSADFDGDALCGAGAAARLPAAAAPDWDPATVPAPATAATWPGACAAGEAPAATPAAGAVSAAPGAGGPAGGATVALGVPEGGVLVRGAVGWGLLGALVLG